MYINNLLIISMVLLISSCNNTNQLNERILLEKYEDCSKIQNKNDQVFNLLP